MVAESSANKQQGDPNQHHDRNPRTDGSPSDPDQSLQRADSREDQKQPGSGSSGVLPARGGGGGRASSPIYAPGEEAPRRSPDQGERNAGSDQWIRDGRGRPESERGGGGATWNRVASVNREGERR